MITGKINILEKRLKLMCKQQMGRKSIDNLVTECGSVVLDVLPFQTTWKPYLTTSVAVV